jgi:hypothetical protein
MDLNREFLSLTSPLRNLWFRKYWEYTYSRKLPSGYSILHILAGSGFYQPVKRLLLLERSYNELKEFWRADAENKIDGRRCV